MLLKSLLALSFLYTTAAQSGGTCTAYPSNATCSSYIDYSVYLPAGATLLQIESQLTSLAQLGEQFGAVSPVCFDAFARFTCANTYPKCVTSDDNKTNVYSGCYNDCLTAVTDCQSLFAMAGLSDALPDCQTAVSPSTGVTLGQDGSCNNIPTKMTQDEMISERLNLSAIPAGFTMQECPAPFLKDPLAAQNSTVDETNCRFGCCVPCPAQNLFYKEGWAEKGFLATDVIRFVSAVLAFILLVSYLVLPDKRRHPSQLILNMAISTFLFSMPVFFSVGNPKRLQCAADSISSGAMGNNNLCAAQGAILIFGSFATCMWCAALILNLHVHTVWNSSFFANKYVYLNAVCWGVPTAFMATAIGLHAVKFEFANLCVVSMEYIFPIFFYPLAAIVCPCFLLHMITFCYIAKIAVKEGVETEMTQSLSTGTMPTDARTGVNGKHVMVAVKIQWRALLLAIIAIVAVLFYWLFYMTQMSRMTRLQNDPSLTMGWLECMLINNDQNSCSSVLAPHLPPFPLMIVAEALVSSIGIWIFVMFAKRSLWREWNDLIYDVRSNFGRRGRLEKTGEQFYAL